MSASLRGHRAWIGLTYFLIAATPGFWVPVISNVLKAQGWDHLITWTFLIMPAAGMLSPLIFASHADNKMPAEKLMGWILLVSSLTFYLAFRELERGLHPERFLIFLSITALVTAPAWSLLSTITFTYIDGGKGEFGTYRVWATVGWMAAGWLVSLFALDTSAGIGKFALITRLLTAVCCFMLPHTPPQGKASGDWRDVLGLRSLKLLRDRDIAVFLVVSALFAIPFAAFYMHTPRMLEDLGIQRVAATMSIGQITEVIAFIFMGVVMRKWRLKWIFVFALLCGLARYILYALAAQQSSVLLALIGVSFHGVCWAFFYESGRIFLDRRVSAGYRNQIQALMGLFSGNLGNITGTLIVGALYSGMVVDGSPGWSGYWWVLSAMIVACTIVFVLGYKGIQTPAPSGNSHTPQPSSP